MEEGSPVSTILGVEKESGASLIVVGALCRRLAEKLIGGAAESLVNHSEVPVLVVRGKGLGS